MPWVWSEATQRHVWARSPSQAAREEQNRNNLHDELRHLRAGQAGCIFLPLHCDGTAEGERSAGLDSGARGFAESRVGSADSPERGLAPKGRGQPSLSRVSPSNNIALNFAGEQAELEEPRGSGKNAAKHFADSPCPWHLPGPAERAGNRRGECGLDRACNC